MFSIYASSVVRPNYDLMFVFGITTKHEREKKKEKSKRIRLDAQCQAQEQQ